MSNHYDDWKLDNGSDYHARVGTHQHGLPPAAIGGMCVCGNETTRSLAGIGWQCRRCGEAAMQRMFQKAVRKTA